MQWRTKCRKFMSRRAFTLQVSRYRVLIVAIVIGVSTACVTLLGFPKLGYEIDSAGDTAGERSQRKSVLSGSTTVKQILPSLTNPSLSQLTAHLQNLTSGKNDTLRNDVTIVTAYFNLGPFQKGELSHNFFTPKLYKKWMNVFSRISNPVVAYFDDVGFFEYFKKQRRQLETNLTSIRMVDRRTLWSFSLKDLIGEIYEQPGYPVHHPNTVLPEYSCAMHAKYELMYLVVQENPFDTKYFAWLDIGLFREISTNKKNRGNSYPETFHIHLPPKFDDSKVAYSDVYRGFQKLSNEQIFKANLVWVCGCFFIGKLDVMARWSVEYLNYVERFVLKEKLMNTDQQVIFAIHSNYRTETQIQTYHTDGRYNEWFYLGYLCKE